MAKMVRYEDDNEVENNIDLTQKKRQQSRMRRTITPMMIKMLRPCVWTAPPGPCVEKYN